MKYLTLALFLTGCILSPEKKVIVHDHEVPTECTQREDSTTFNDSGEVWHYSCRVDPK